MLYIRVSAFLKCSNFIGELFATSERSGVFSADESSTISHVKESVSPAMIIVLSFVLGSLALAVSAFGLVWIYRRNSGSTRQSYQHPGF